MSTLENQARISTSLGGYERPLSETLDFLERERFSERIWDKDATLWKGAPEIQEKIKNRLGWLTVAKSMAKEAEALGLFARSIKDSGIDHVVLLGMGGSSMCPEVCLKTYGVRPGYPKFTVLDSTDPATILNVEHSLDFRRSLFILASKSGTTIEVQSLYRHFYEKLRAIQGDSLGDHFIVITDPGTPLEDMGRAERFRRVFLNPPDIGGRYSALSYFGLVPAAIMGVDLTEFLMHAQEMMHQCAPGVPIKDHPAIMLGAVLGGMGKVGRDKVTLIASEPIDTFGVWAEQLIAESTGKEGKGLVPVDGERIGEPRVYGEDRLFVHLSVGSAPDAELDRKVKTLEDAGHPVVRIHLKDPMFLGAEFFRWEMATAVAGFVLGINPFDEPNVSESKQNTSKALDTYKNSGALDLPGAVIEEGGIAIAGDVRVAKDGSIMDAVDRFLVQAGANDYVAVMAYVEQNNRHESLLQEFRHRIRDRYRIATTLGYGPRFLHSTGQLHKGGGGNGLFIQITAEDPEEIQIPGGTYGFGILKRAQALGDFLSLKEKGLRVIEIRLGSNIEEDLQKLLQALQLR